MEERAGVGEETLVRPAGPDDLVWLRTNDDHVRPTILAEKMDRGEILVAITGGQLVGSLRYGYFWDMIPFMNMLVVEERYRNLGIGTRLIQAWEETMRDQGYSEVMTSTMSDERAQHLYRRLGYRDCGALLLPGEALELLLRKEL